MHEPTMYPYYESATANRAAARTAIADGDYEAFVFFTNRARVVAGKREFPVYKTAAMNRVAAKRFTTLRDAESARFFTIAAKLLAGGRGAAPVAPPIPA